MNFKLMKTLPALVVGVIVAGAHAGDQAPAVRANATNRFTISGMHCDGCAQGVAGELKLAPGIAWATVTFSNRLAVVAYDTNRASVKSIRKTVAAAGYAAQPVKN